MTSRWTARVADEADPVFLGYSGSLRDIRGMLKCIRDLRRTARDFQADIVIAAGAGELSAQRLGL